jgi:hypothetical protein
MCCETEDQNKRKKNRSPNGKEHDTEPVKKPETAKYRRQKNIRPSLPEITYISARLEDDETLVITCGLIEKEECRLKQNHRWWNRIKNRTYINSVLICSAL